MAHQCLTTDQLVRDLAIRDLSDPSDGPHAVQLLVDLAAGALEERWGCSVLRRRGPRVVSVGDNYDALGFEHGTVTRDARYTRYVDDGHLLRSHSSALVPPALRELAALPDEERPADVLLVCPALCYRRDAIDWQHTGTPHQLDLWRITRSPMSDLDMDDMIEVLLEALVPGRRSNTEPRVHPYTLNGRQVDVLAGDRWVEVWECGLAHPGVLARAGLGGWSGLALGMGLDRMLMLQKGIPDIRLLRSSDERVASQMRHLEPYRTVSAMPPVVRDLSIAVADDDDPETLGDRAREALGDDAACVEALEVLSATPCADLPPAAVEQLGISAGQQNLLVRVVLRSLDRTLTDAEANELRDRVYAALHQGSASQWATARPR